jgi:hypothetical protein
VRIIEARRETAALLTRTVREFDIVTLTTKPDVVEEAIYSVLGRFAQMVDHIITEDERDRQARAAQAKANRYRR